MLVTSATEILAACAIEKKKKPRHTSTLLRSKILDSKCRPWVRRASMAASMALKHGSAHQSFNVSKSPAMKAWRNREGGQERETGEEKYRTRQITAALQMRGYNFPRRLQATHL